MPPLNSTGKKFFTGKFYFRGRPVEDGPSYGMTLKAAGSMRFRWNERNVNRENFLAELAGIERRTVAVELIHSQNVFAVDSPDELELMQGDGIITVNRELVPVVTVADCMPIFIFDPVTGVFGTLHSGWKGTGIVGNAIRLAEKKYGSRPEDFCVVMGPHIHECCYLVDEERAKYFRVNFTPDCVEEEKTGGYRLSLARANLSVLREIGVDEDSIVSYSDCTCCNPLFGSFRRETANLPPGMDMEERQRHFTVQAAWVRW